MSSHRFIKYVDTNSILIMKPDRILCRIYCPFAVMEIDTQKILTVCTITLKKDGIMHYKINGQYLKYSFFTILDA